MASSAHMATAAEQLAEVEAAISAVQTGGQMYMLRDSTQVQRASLAQLEERRLKLKVEVEQAASGGGMYRRVGFKSAS